MSLPELLAAAQVAKDTDERLSQLAERRAKLEADLAAVTQEVKDRQGALSLALAAVKAAAGKLA